MATASEFSSGLGTKMVNAAAKAGFMPQEYNRLAEDLRLMKDVLSVLRGQSEIVPTVHIIDLDADPTLPFKGTRVEMHSKLGQFKWDPAKVQLFTPMNGLSVGPEELRKYLATQPVFNANMLDYLLQHPALIPESWKKSEETGQPIRVYFWGTIYRGSDGLLFVRYLTFDDGVCGEGRCSWHEGIGMSSVDHAVRIATA
jgi:hypothetical protein